MGSLKRNHFFFICLQIVVYYVIHSLFPSFGSKEFFILQFFLYFSLRLFHIFKWFRFIVAFFHYYEHYYGCVLHIEFDFEANYNFMKSVMDGSKMNAQTQ